MKKLEQKFASLQIVKIVEKLGNEKVKANFGNHLLFRQIIKSFFFSFSKASKFSARE